MHSYFRDSEDCARIMKNPSYIKNPVEQIVSSISCYFMVQSRDTSLGLKDPSCLHYAQYLCYVTMTPPSNELPLGLLNASHFQLMRW